MFGKKTPPQSVVLPNAAAISVETIPAAFYGGNDPVIYQDPEPVPQRKPAPPAAVPPRTPPPSAPPAGQISHPAQTNHKKIFIIVGIVLVVFAVAGSAWFYLSAPAPVEPVAQAPVPPSFSEPAPTELQPEPVQITTSTPEEIPATPSALTLIPLDFPTILLADNIDDDTDSLTDSEEEIFGTDTGVWDSDQDGYYDGQEVYNLYNPKGFAPVKIIDSGLVREYVNPTWQYRVYYPANWEIGSVDTRSDQVLISSIGGDYVEIRAVEKMAGETFSEWFTRVASQQFITDLQQSKNRFEESVSIRKDSLVAYSDQEKVVYVLLYHPNSDGPVNYRHIIQMMIQSFRPSKTSVVLPEQAIVPKPPQSEIETTSPAIEASTTTQ